MSSGLSSRRSNDDGVKHTDKTRERERDTEMRKNARRAKWYPRYEFHFKSTTNKDEDVCGRCSLFRWINLQKLTSPLNHAKNYHRRVLKPSDKIHVEPPSKVPFGVFRENTFDTSKILTNLEDNTLLILRQLAWIKIHPNYSARYRTRGQNFPTLLVI